MEDGIGLGHVVWETQLVDSAASGEPSAVHAEQPFSFGIEELEVELSSLDKTEGHAFGLGTGMAARAEQAAHRGCECGPHVRVGDERRRLEASLFFLFGGAEEVVPPEGGPVRLGELDAFVAEALDDVAKSWILIGGEKKAESNQSAKWLPVC